MATSTRTCANPECTNPKGNVLPSTDFNKGRRTCKYCDRKRAREHRKQKWNKCHRTMNRYLGKNCVVCGEKRGWLLRCHEKFGKPHPKLLDTPLGEVKANCKSGRFVRVCARCHGKAHAVIEKGIVDWELIKFHIREFLKTDPPIENDAHLRAWHRFIKDKVMVRQPPLPIEVESPPPTAKSEPPYGHRNDDEDGEPDIESICMNLTTSTVPPA